MNLVVISHPSFFNSRSMPLFTHMLCDSFGAKVVLRPSPVFFRLPAPRKLKKWLGYIDQYLIFPFLLRWKVAGFASDTLFVFADQALGPWVPWVCHRPHVIHCHDLMALRSALGEIPENPIGFFGKLYQRFIRWGFSKGRNFISVSEKTRIDLHRLACISAERSVVVHNGLNYPYKPMVRDERMHILYAAGLPVEARGMLLHVGGAQWYKNRPGVVAMYAAYAASVDDPLSLWMVGPLEQSAVLDAIKKVPPQGKVHLISGVSAEVLQAVYSHSVLFLFPSLDEGFGWPIAEAQASGCPVLTTDAAPMTEVGGGAAFYHDRLTAGSEEVWASRGAQKIREILSLSARERADVINRGIDNACRFDSSRAVEAYAEVYFQVLNEKGIVA